MIEDGKAPLPLREREGPAAERWEGEGEAPTRKELLARAKWMRAHPTEAETRLWSMLRDRRLTAHKFKRQQIIAPHIADFCCLKQRIIIEADGSQHADNKDDARRDAFLRRQGFRLLRFWNNEVLEQSAEVADAIFSALSGPHPPTHLRYATAGEPLPLPQGERG